ncbi:MAG: hypothetical protein IPJ17_15715 [Holophagales bacterium]|nr:MAG: hypothetical protein IPJ17_15715 [Holophagales bacterium]
MVSLASLWLPILLSAIGVFVVSSILHMVLPLHRGDYHKLPNEAETLEVLGRNTLAPGIYQLPFCTMEGMKSPDTVAKFEKGPVGTLTIVPSGRPAMGKYLGTWLVYCLVVGFFTAYLAAHTVAAGAHYLAVFRVVGACAFMAYGLGQVVDSIWRGQPWGVTFKHVADGLIYSLVTAGFFGWLWPR